ncbi:MAG: hypothetical protein ABFD66_13215 [Smithella sp.]
MNRFGCAWIELISPYRLEKVVAILREQADPMPSFLTCIGRSSARFRGTSRTCGTVTDSGFELRNRRDPLTSLRAWGKLIALPKGTRIELTFRKPSLFQFLLSGLFFVRHDDDRSVILDFLKEWVRAREAE